MLGLDGSEFFYLSQLNTGPNPNYTRNLTENLLDFTFFGKIQNLDQAQQANVQNVFRVFSETGEGAKVEQLLQSVREEAFADDFALLTAPKMELPLVANQSGMHLSGFVEDGINGPQWVPKGAGRLGKNDEIDSLARTFIEGELTGYGDEKGTQWRHYAESYLGKDAYATLGEEHQTSLHTLLTEYYNNNRTTALSTRTLDSDTMHLPQVRKILAAQGYDSTEIERVIGGMRDVANFHNNQIDSNDPNVRSVRRLFFSETEKADTLTRNPSTKLMAGTHSMGAGNRPLIVLGDNLPKASIASSEASAIASEMSASAKIATRKIGNSAAGRSFFSEAVSSASGAKVIQLAKNSRRILQDIF